MAFLYMILSLAEELKNVSENPEECKRLENLIDDDLRELVWI